MDYINFIFLLLVILIAYIVITKIWMEIANYIGEKLRISTFFMWLLEKIKRTRA